MTAVRIALVSSDGPARAVLARYLDGVGFAVHGCDELASPTGFEAVVFVNDRAIAADAMVARVRAWLRATSPRVVVVTSRPSALKELVVEHGDRLVVLAAPAFGWDVVDALRARPPGVE